MQKISFVSEASDFQEMIDLLKYFKFFFLLIEGSAICSLWIDLQIACVWLRIPRIWLNWIMATEYYHIFLKWTLM